MKSLSERIQDLRNWLGGEEPISEETFSKLIQCSLISLRRWSGGDQKAVSGEKKLAALERLKSHPQVDPKRVMETLMDFPDFDDDENPSSLTIERSPLDCDAWEAITSLFLDLSPRAAKIVAQHIGPQLFETIKKKPTELEMLATEKADDGTLLYDLDALRLLEKDPARLFAADKAALCSYLNAITDNEKYTQLTFLYYAIALKKPDVFAGLFGIGGDRLLRHVLTPSGRRHILGEEE